MALLDPYTRITVTTNEREGAWNKVTTNGLPRELPYPKIMRQTSCPDNIIFTIASGMSYVLKDSLYRTGFSLVVKDADYYDYDGVVHDDWLFVINAHCSMKDTPHFNRYNTVEERIKTLKNIKHKDGTAYVTRLERECYTLYHEYHNN